MNTEISQMSPPLLLSDNTVPKPSQMEPVCSACNRHSYKKNPHIIAVKYRSHYFFNTDATIEKLGTTAWG